MEKETIGLLVFAIIGILFVISMILMYIEKDFNKGIYYKGRLGKFQRFINGGNNE
jgi:hypothetical protein